MKTHIVKFLQFLEDKEGINVPLRLKLLNQDGFNITKDELNVKGNLNLIKTDIVSLPEGLRVSNYLNLPGCTSLTSLPDGLYAGELILRGCTSLTSLPNNLKVVFNLDLNDCTSLTSLPDGLQVSRDLFLKNTPLAEMYNADEIRAMIESKGGYVGRDIYI